MSKSKRQREHRNKYAHLAPKSKVYDRENKTQRKLPLSGIKGKAFLPGLKMLYHGRLYILQARVLIGDTGMGWGDFVLHRHVPDGGPTK